MVSGILLGAGESKRMGRNKLLLSWGKGTIFDRCLQILLRSHLDEVVAVLNPKSPEVRNRIERLPEVLKKRVRIILNPGFQQGMSSSIRLGLRQIHPASDGALFALGDQPLLRAGTINALIHVFDGDQNKIVVPFYQGRRGNPVLFGRTYFKELMETRGDSGGRLILEHHPDQVIRYRTQSRAVLVDIDTWEEYGKAQSSRLKAIDIKRQEDK
jgi:molybdenum cofactor cytidylyltransferase